MIVLFEIEHFIINLFSYDFFTMSKKRAFINLLIIVILIFMADLIFLKSIYDIIN